MGYVVEKTSQFHYIHNSNLGPIMDFQYFIFILKNSLLQDEFVERFKDKFANDEPKHVSFENRVVTIEYDIDSPANVNGENDVNYESLDEPKNNLEKSTTTQTAQA